jgi:geranylgeranyl pyrophosphate synthase
MILSADGLPVERRAECARILAEASGCRGMVAGQVLDTLHEPKTEAELRQVHGLKTGALIRAACEMGCVCGGADAAFRGAARVYAENLGMAFQIRDDMLDVIGNADEFGKPIGSDREEGKVTFVDLLGLDGCEEAVMTCTETAKAVVSGEEILQMRALAATVPVIDEVLDYTARLVSGTHPEIEGASDVAKKYIKYGASPRAAQALITCAKVRALINGNYNVSYEDINALAAPVLRHRIKINYAAVNDKLTVDDVIAQLIKATKK